MTFDTFTVANVIDTLQASLIYVGGLLTGMFIMWLDRDKPKS